MVILGPLFNFYIDNAGHGLTVFGIKATRNHFHFFNSIYIQVQIGGTS